jgi:hypothetical protein
MRRESAQISQVEEEWKLLTQPKEAAAEPNPSASAEPNPSASVPQEANGQEDAMETDELMSAAPAPESTAAESELTPEEVRVKGLHKKLAGIMRGETSIQLYLEFLHSHNHADIQAIAPSFPLTVDASVLRRL